MSDAVGSLGTSARGSFSIFRASRLQLYGYALALIYAVALIHYYLARAWIVDNTGLPIYTDFAVWWAGGMQALHGNPAALYDPAEFDKIQAALFRPGEAV